MSTAGAEKGDPLFRTITSEDWRRSIARSRNTPNTVLEKIRAKIADMKTKSAPPMQPPPMRVYQYHVATRDNEPCILDGFKLHPQGLLRPCEVGEKPHNFGDYYAKGHAAAESAIARTIEFAAELQKQGHMFPDWDGLTKFETPRKFVIYHAASPKKLRRPVKLEFAT